MLWPNGLWPGTYGWACMGADMIYTCQNEINKSIKSIVNCVDSERNNHFWAKGCISTLRLLNALSEQSETEWSIRTVYSAQFSNLSTYAAKQPCHALFLLWAAGYNLL